MLFQLFTPQICVLGMSGAPDTAQKLRAAVCRALPGILDKWDTGALQQFRPGLMALMFENNLLCI